MYKYTKRSLMMQGTIVFLALILTVFGNHIAFQLIAAFVGILMGKDLAISMTTDIVLDDEGMLEKSKFRTRYRIKWSEVEYVTITRKNKKWIIIGNDDQFYTLKPLIKDYELMAKDIVEKVNAVKKVRVHEYLLPRLGLKYKLDGYGFIKK